MRESSFSAVSFNQLIMITQAGRVMNKHKSWHYPENKDKLSLLEQR